MSPLRRTVGGRIFPAMVVVVGLVTLWIGVDNMRQASASVGWPAVPGVVTRTSLESQISGGSGGRTRSQTWRPVVVYEYEVNGAVHEADRISFGEYATSDRADAAAVLQRYPTGTRVTVRYRPGQPDVAVLEPGTAGVPWFFIVLGAVFTVVGILLIVVVPRIIARVAR
ncbi:MAG: DUF3592 domain-containing protein [Vicinamibacterales bacterium]